MLATKSRCCGVLVLTLGDIEVGIKVEIDRAESSKGVCEALYRTGTKNGR
jgi:hypothetical protein